MDGCSIGQSFNLATQLIFNAQVVINRDRRGHIELPFQCVLGGGVVDEYTYKVIVLG